MSKEHIYKKALVDIANASDQANPIQLKAVAQVALDSEPTTADEFNVPVITGDKDTDALLEDERIAQDENLKSQQDMLDRHRDMESKIVKYDRKLSEAASEAAESVWRGTVLSKNYKSPFDEEE